MQVLSIDLNTARDGKMAGQIIRIWVSIRFFCAKIVRLLLVRVISLKG